MTAWLTACFCQKIPPSRFLFLNLFVGLLFACHTKHPSACIVFFTTLSLTPNNSFSLSMWVHERTRVSVCVCVGVVVPSTLSFPQESRTWRTFRHDELLLRTLSICLHAVLYGGTLCHWCSNLFVGMGRGREGGFEWNKVEVMCKHDGSCMLSSSQEKYQPKPLSIFF